MTVGINKVEFGVKNVHMGTYATAADGTVTLGSPTLVPGIRKMTRDVNSEMQHLAADDKEDYWEENEENGGSGELEFANVSDAFKTTFLKYVQNADGGISHKETKECGKVYIIFQSDGDNHKKRHILYNVTLGALKRERNTRDGAKAPDTVTLPYSYKRDEATGITDTSYVPDDAMYTTMLTTPPVPGGAPAQSGGGGGASGGESGGGATGGESGGGASGESSGATG